MENDSGQTAGVACGLAAFLALYTGGRQLWGWPAAREQKRACCFGRIVLF